MTGIPARDLAKNVWLQLGLPDAEEHYLKAELVLRLSRAIKALGLTQRILSIVAKSEAKTWLAQSGRLE